MVFQSCGATCGVFLDIRRVTEGASRVAPGKSSLHSPCEGERCIALESWLGIRSQDALKVNLKIFLELRQITLGFLDL